MNFELVTGISKDYLKIAKLTIPTWRMKPQFKDKKLIIFYSELEEKDLKFFTSIWKNIKLVKWEMEEYKSTRELMLSAFVLGTSVHVETDHWVKLDCDSYFTNTDDVFQEEHFGYDMYGQSWGYTKPRNWLIEMDEWAGGNGVAGGSLFEGIEPGENGYSHKRIISKICLHRTEFVKEVVSYTPKRLPIPSHDTFLWYMAERLPDRKWGASKLMQRHGVGNKSMYKSIKRELDKFNVIDVDGRERSAKRYHYGYEHNLFDKVQIEITALCNLSCPNCDRSCGQQQAPTTDHMEVKQIQRFVKKSLKMKHKWKRIDVIGGEPTLHPEIDKIWEELKKYKDEYPSTLVRITTNGKGAKVKSVIEQIPKWVKIKNTDKETNHISEGGGFTAFNDAPIDHGIEDAPVCDIPWRCGLGMTPNGFYPCGAGGGIDRVMGLGIGINRLEKVTTENLMKQTKELCKLCGHSPTCNKHNTDKQENSKVWEDAYKKYQDEENSSPPQ